MGQEGHPAKIMFPCTNLTRLSPCTRVNDIEFGSRMDIIMLLIVSVEIVDFTVNLQFAYHHHHHQNDTWLRSKQQRVTVKVGIPGFGDGRPSRLSRQVVLAMTLPQLQVVVNDMLTQIECTSPLLVTLSIGVGIVELAGARTPKFLTAGTRGSTTQILCCAPNTSLGRLKLAQG